MSSALWACIYTGLSYSLFSGAWMGESGVYIAVFYLTRRQRITVGKLGCYDFSVGYYFYVGSAQRNLDSRIERHGRKNKTLRWHIDYLSVKADMLGAITVRGKRSRECELAEEFGQAYELAVPGFGASDCRCGGHLFYARELL